MAKSIKITGVWGLRIATFCLLMLRHPDKDLQHGPRHLAHIYWYSMWTKYTNTIRRALLDQIRALTSSAFSCHTLSLHMTSGSHMNRAWVALSPGVGPAPQTDIQGNSSLGHGGSIQSSWLIVTDKSDLHETDPNLLFKPFRFVAIKNTSCGSELHKLIMHWVKMYLLLSVLIYCGALSLLSLSSEMLIRRKCSLFQLSSHPS